MPLENANTIAQLNVGWPQGGDSVMNGDDHIRLIKKVLQHQFVNKNGTPWSKPLKLDIDDLNNYLGKVYPVGSVVLRMDDVNPATLFGGTWQLITGDANLTFGDGSVMSGAVTGQNEIAITLPRHRHKLTSVRHTHTRGTMEISGSVLRLGEGFQDSGAASGAFAKITGSRGNTYHHQDGSTSGSFDFKASRGWTGHTSEALANAYSDYDGTANPKMDTRGARIAINVWKRTA